MIGKLKLEHNKNDRCEEQIIGKKIDEKEKDYAEKLELAVQAMKDCNLDLR